MQNQCVGVVIKSSGS